jgi:uncharacterized protein YmfQ (DUF2313 family)
VHAVTAFYADPKFVAWLADQEPRTELIARMALKTDVSDPTASYDWDARIDTLIEKLKPSDVELVEIMCAAERAYKRLEHALALDPG